MTSTKLVPFAVALLLASAGLASAQQEVFIYDNTATFLQAYFANGGAAVQGANTITTLVADDIQPLAGYGGQSVSNIYFAVANGNATAVSARPRLRFYDSDGASGGPGTLLGGFTFNPISFAANTASGFYFSPTGFPVPSSGYFWFGMTFDNNSGGSGAMTNTLDNLGMPLFDPPVVGVSADGFFQTSAAGSFLASNPAGGFFFFNGSPVANFYFAMSVSGTNAGGNQPPVATPQSVTVGKNGSAAITLIANDPDGDPLTYAIVNSPTNGTLTGTPPNVTYAPNTNFAGSDAFTFKANDGLTDSVPALVSITVVPGAGLVITPIFDTSITSDPNAAKIMATINSAILVFENKFSDHVIVPVLFASMGSGLGRNQTYIGSLSYPNFLTALTADARTTNDITALANIPAGALDPVAGGPNVTLTTPNLRALGFSATPPTNFDSTISVNISACNLDRVTIDSTKYDLMAVVSHELDEVLGTISGLGQPNIFPADLFRYSSTPGTRNFTTAGDDAWFSIDGINRLVQYNQNSGGDYGDWWSLGTHTPRVQDAFGTPGATPDLGVELSVLDVVGWDLVVPAGAPQIQSIAHVGGNINLTWSAVTGRSYQPEYKTNLNSSVWSNLGGPILATGPTVTVSDPFGSNQQRFYRVVLLFGPVPAPPVPGASQPNVSPLTLRTSYFPPSPNPPAGQVRVLNGRTFQQLTTWEFEGPGSSRK
jgi:hypothetical protein